MPLPRRSRFLSRFKRRRPPGDEGAHESLSYRPPKTLVMFRIGMGAGITVFVSLLAWVGLWLLGAMIFRDTATAWVDARIAEGWGVEYARLELGGFPFNVEGEFTNPSLISPEGGARIAWRADRLFARARPWSPSTVTVDFSGPSHAVDIIADGAMRSYAGGANKLDVTVSGGGPIPELVKISAEDIYLKGERGDAISVYRLNLETAWRPDPRADAKTSTFDLMLNSQGLRLPDALDLPLGNRVAELSAEAYIRGNIPIDRPLAEALTQWRDRGGTLRIPRLVAGYGPLSAEAGGTLALDEELQPVGSLTALFVGFFETVEQLRVKRLIGGREATTAKLMLSAFAKRKRKGGPPTLSVPLNLKNRTLYVSQVPLVEFPEILWTRHAPEAAVPPPPSGR